MNAARLKIRFSSRRCWDALLRSAAPLRQLLLPNRCAHCDAEIASLDDACLVCAECRRLLACGGAPRCPRCAEPLVGDQLAACRSCRERLPPFERAWALGDYSDGLRTAVLKIKQPSAEPLAAALADLLYQERGVAIREWRPDAILPVPMHWFRRLARGANSAETLSSVLAKRLGAPHAAGCIFRRRRTRPQSGLASGERFRNVRGAFRLRGGIDWAGARILVVDDILTTGATCGEISRLLVAAGVSATAAVVVARASDASPR
jgi:ComF family protein